MRPSSVLVPVLALVVAGSSLAADDFVVNSYTTNNQNNPSVAAASNGSFVVAWEGQDGAGSGIVGRRFAADGSPLSGSFTVNTYTTGAQTKPAVAVRPTGEFVVVWNGYGAADEIFGIFGRVYDAGGNPQGAEFHVNAYTTNNQLAPRVAYDGTGEMVVVWASTGADDPGNSNTGIAARRLDSSGSPLTGEFIVNSTTGGDQRYPSLAFQSDDDFVVVWQSYGSGGDDTSAASIQMQRYAANGSMLGGETQVNGYTTSAQLEPSVAVQGDDGFVVVWESLGSPENDSDSFSVQARRFAANGASVGGQFQVNAGTVGSQNSEGDAVAVTADGSIAVVWDESGGAFADPAGVRGIVLAADGTPQGPEFQVNGYTAGTQGQPSVTAAGDGFVVVWEGYAANEDLFGIRGRVLEVPDPIFADGFESGTTSAWSSSVP